MSKNRSGKEPGKEAYESALIAFESWFERQKRVLPWRDQPAVYRVWVSEIMLQQTQVVTVIPYFEKFIARFPDVHALASATEEEVMLHWAGLGYYSRARNLHRAAKQLAESGFPADREGWLKVPGVGDYTAGAILSISDNQVEAILDGNVERVLSRVHRVDRQKGDAEFKRSLWGLSEKFVKDSHSLGLQPSRINQALMELGATLCTPRKPLCVFCPLASICQAHHLGEEEIYPPRKKPKQWLKVDEEVHFYLREAGSFLVQKRQAGEWRAGLWDLPRVSPHMISSGAPAEKIGTIETRYIVTRHKVTRLTHVWKLKGWSASDSISSLDELAGAEVRWTQFAKNEVPIGSALRKTLQQIRERFPEVAPED